MFFSDTTIPGFEFVIIYTILTLWNHGRYLSKCKKGVNFVTDPIKIAEKNDKNIELELLRYGDQVPLLLLTDDSLSVLLCYGEVFH